MSDSEKDAKSAEGFEPICAVDIINAQRDGVKRSVGAQIVDNGNLVIDGLDWGELAHGMLGGDYEYSVTVDAKFKDSVLLLLLQEKFKDFPPAKEWLKEKGIPFTEWKWG